MPHLASAIDTLRLSLHVISASIWVGGQITMAGLLPKIRSLGENASKTLARAFRIFAWPSYFVLLATGVWNVFAIHLASADTSYKIALWTLIFFALLSGFAAYFHSISKKKSWLAVWGSLAGLAAVIAMVLGIWISG
jgi:putative copper export protein